MEGDQLFENLATADVAFQSTPSAWRETIHLITSYAW